MRTSMLPKLGVSHVGKSIQLAAASLLDLGIDLLGLYEGLDSLARALLCLALLACISFRPFLCFLAKHMPLRSFGSTPLRDLYTPVCVLLGFDVHRQTDPFSQVT